MRTTPIRAWTWLRDRYSASVLGTTSAHMPGLDGGLSRPARLGITAGSFALALLAALAIGTPSGALFFFPALMVGGIFGGAELALAALVLAILATRAMFPGLNLWLFGGALAVQVFLALGMRVLFRESRRWGVRYRRLLGAISSAVTVSDGQGRIGRPHPELEKLIGMEWPSYRGPRWLAAVNPQDQKSLLPAGPFKDVALQRAEIRLKDPRTGDWRWHLMRAVPLMDEKGEVEEWISVLTDIHESKLASEQREVMIGEARHRLKNLITIIDSLAKSSRPAERDPAVDAFLSKYLGRLHALSAAGDLALANNYTTMQIEDVTRATLAPFLEKDSQRLTFGGPRLELSEATGGGLAMGLNELATNAIKYGALSVPQGRARFTWSVAPEDGGERVTMEWRESGGPPPVPPNKKGYGARVIEFIVSRESQGTVDVSYAPEGYACRITFLKPLKPRVKTLEAE
ncbi:MAG TPA: HWE histidine kinase domain-containing protein [Rhizomicrobium sp.]|nr:HWE histidine kinase domain-containing protein [Rhizomicrobium sp.]